MKQYRITSQDIIQNAPEDCYLSPDDPIHELKISQQLGGLGSQQRLDAHRATKFDNNISINKGQEQQEKNIKPGTDEWFKLWFGK